jgi:hypothetical protein
MFTDFFCRKDDFRGEISKNFLGAKISLEHARAIYKKLGVKHPSTTSTCPLDLVVTRDPKILGREGITYCYVRVR